MVKKRKAELNTPFFELILKLIEYKNFLQYIEKKNFSNKKIKIEDNILISGSPRSGTTWLMELMSDIPDYTFIFEPLHPGLFQQGFKVGFSNKTYVPVDKDWNVGKNYLRKVFTGEIVTVLPAYGPSLKMAMRRILAHRFIIKTIRMNRLLPWVSERFDFRSIFLIIRHPCAVVASQLKTGIYGYDHKYPPFSSYMPDTKTIINEISEIESIDDEMKGCLKKIKTKEEILAAAWCIDNLIPLSYNKQFPWKTIFYEDLVKNGEKVLTDLFKNIGVEKTQRQKNRLLKKQSLTAPKNKDKNTITNYEKQLSKWKRYLSKKQIDRILRVVSIFGLDFYNEDIEPDYGKIYF